MEFYEDDANTEKVTIKENLPLNADSGHSQTGDVRNIKREQDSLDDFEHLDRDSSPAGDTEKARMHAGAVDQEDAMFGLPSVAAAHGLSRLIDEDAAGEARGVRAAQAFLDTEREEVEVAPARIAPSPPAPPPEDPLFTDSKEELSPAPSEESLPDVVDTFSAPEKALPATPPSPPSPVFTKPAVAPVLIPASAPPRTPSPVEVPTYKEPVPASPTPTATAQHAAAKVAEAAASVPEPRPVMEAEAIFCQMGLDAWFTPDRLHPKVESLVYWRCPAKSGAALGGGLLLLLALACCSLISVLAYASLTVLLGTTIFRVYSSVLQAVQKTTDGHPFKDLLDKDLSVSQERAQDLATLATAHLNAAVSELRRLFLVEDLIDSLKFGVMLWCLTYLGAWFNGMTLIIIAYVALFTLPKVYESNKAQIDANLEVVSAKFQEITNKVKAAIPIGKKGESEKDK